jgi:hypothetical protein
MYVFAVLYCIFIWKKTFNVYFTKPCIFKIAFWSHPTKETAKLQLQYYTYLLLYE